MLEKFLLIASGFALCGLTYISITAAIAYKRYRQFKKLAPKELDETQLCKGPHSWLNVAAQTDEGIEDVKICRLCGFVSGKDLMVPLESVDRIEEGKKLISIEKRLWDEFVAKEDEQMFDFLDEEIKRGLDKKKITAIHGAGLSFEKRFALYVDSKREEIEKEVNRSN